MPSLFRSALLALPVAALALTTTVLTSATAQADQKSVV